MIVTKSGVTLSVSGNIITCSDGHIFQYSGGMLLGNTGFMSMSVNSMDAAVEIVVGMYGGRLY